MVIKFLLISKRNCIIIPFTCPVVSTMGSVNSATALSTHSQEHLLSVSLFPQLNCSFNSFLPFFFLLSHSVSLLLALSGGIIACVLIEMRCNCSQPELILSSCIKHFIKYLPLIKMKYSSIINVHFHFNFVICHAKTSETIRSLYN